MEEEVKRRGRPKGTLKSELLEEVCEGKYTDQTPKLVLKLFTEGKLPPQVCKILKIKKGTFNDWLEEYPEFNKAYELGIVACEAFWIEEGVEGLKAGKKFNFNQWMSFMSNIFKWARINAGENITNITKIGTVTQINKYEQYSDDQLRAFLLSKIEQNKLIPLDCPKLELKLSAAPIEAEYKDQSGIVNAEIESGRDLSKKVS